MKLIISGPIAIGGLITFFIGLVHGRAPMILGGAGLVFASMALYSYL